MNKLLIVENEMLERKFLCQTLQKQIGNIFEIYEAENEIEAIEIFEKEKIQIAVFLKKEQIIIVKVVDYLLKPYEEDELIERVKEAISNSRKRRENEESDCVQLITKTEGQKFAKIKRRMEQYVERHYMEEISAYSAAEQMNYSEAYFCKLFKEYFGMSFVSYLAKYRINEAKKLIESSNLAIKEIGKICGYPDPCYFTRVFKKETGYTPSEYRNLAEIE